MAFYGLVSSSEFERNYFGQREIRNDPERLRKIGERLKKSIRNSNVFKGYFYSQEEKIFIEMSLFGYLTSEYGVLSFQETEYHLQQMNIFFHEQEARYYQSVFPFEKALYKDSLKKKMVEEESKFDFNKVLQLEIFYQMLDRDETLLEKYFMLLSREFDLLLFLKKFTQFVEVLNLFLVNNHESLQATQCLYLKHQMIVLEEQFLSSLSRIGTYLAKTLFVLIISHLKYCQQLMDVLRQFPEMEKDQVLK